MYLDWHPVCPDIWYFFCVHRGNFMVHACFVCVSVHSIYIKTALWDFYFILFDQLHWAVHGERPPAAPMIFSFSFSFETHPLLWFALSHLLAPLHLGDLWVFKWWSPTRCSGPCATTRRNTSSSPVALTERWALGPVLLLCTRWLNILNLFKGT